MYACNLHDVSATSARNGHLHFSTAFSGIYVCPCYYYPNRAGGSGRASFIVSVDLKVGEKSADHWCKRGTAMLMSLDN